MDDILSALDVHTAKWIVDKCFKGDLIQGRTVLLITHNIAIATPIAEFVVSIDSDGCIASQGTVSDALNQNKALLTQVSNNTEPVSHDIAEVKEEAPREQGNTSGKLMTTEEIAEGHIGFPACKSGFAGLFDISYSNLHYSGIVMLYLKSLGGPIFWVTFLIILGITHFLFV